MEDKQPEGAQRDTMSAPRHTPVPSIAVAEPETAHIDRRAKVALSAFGLVLLALRAGLVIHPSAMPVRDVIGRISSGVQSLFASRQTEPTRADLKAAYAPHVVKTVPIFARPAALQSAADRPAITSEVVPHPVKTVPIISRPPSANSTRTNNAAPPPTGSFTPSVPLPAPQ